MDTGFFSFFLPQAISWIPLVIVWAFGLSKAHGLTGKYAGVGKKATIAFAGFIALRVISNVTFALIITRFETISVGRVMGGFNIVAIIIDVLLWILIIGAIFDEREKGAKLPEDDPFAN